MGKKSNLMHQAIKQLNKQKKFGESNRHHSLRGDDASVFL